jgi:catechol 2,3-dioxygenase-like lactoylglutathione lyase family enzyme
VEGDVLASDPVVAFLAATNAERARSFCKGVLGLRFVANETHSLVSDCKGTMLRISTVDSLRPQAFTMLGWAVADLEGTMSHLARRGVEFERHGGFRQDERDVASFADGTKVAWFRDPDGNGLPLTQFGAKG